jgi:hypothetical protein
MEMNVYENQLHLHYALPYAKMFMTFGSISVNWISNTIITALLRKYNHKTGHSRNGFIKPNMIHLGIPDFRSFRNFSM